MDVSPTSLSQDETILETQINNETPQPDIEADDEEEYAEEEVAEDEMEEEDKDLDEDALRAYYKVDSVKTIASLRMKPEQLFRLQIPLCRMVAMSMVRPTLACDLKKLEQESTTGYREGAAVFYVSTTNEAGESSVFSEEEMAEWDPMWKKKNAIFNAHVESLPELQFLKNIKFYVCDGNHRLLVWMNYITRKHSKDWDWHYAVDSIVLDAKGKTEMVMHVM